MRSLVNERGLRAAARTLNVHTSVVSRITNGLPVSTNTVVALRTKVKSAGDFSSMASLVRQPKKTKPNTGWTLDRIRAARDAQLAGDFRTAAPLGVAMRLDDAIFVAFQNRVAPMSALAVDLKSVGGVRGDAIRKRALDSLVVPRGTLSSLVGTLAMHGVAIGYLLHDTDDAGTTVGMTLTEWPIEFVKWDETSRAFVTKVEGAPDETIVHGDGRWIVFTRHDLNPFQHGALLPSALIFSAHIDAIKSWAAASNSHGQAKIIGELPEGVPLRDGDTDTLSPDAQLFLDMLSDIVNGEVGAGLKPSGAQADFIANGSSAWQVFSELSLNREKAAARVWNGNDGALGSVGGAPGVDITTLFGVATTIVQGDAGAIERGLYSGMIVPWCAINYGDSKHAPRYSIEVPDVDRAQIVEQEAAAADAFFAEIEKRKANGFEITQSVVDDVAARYRITPPQLATQAAAVVPLTLAPTTIALFVRVREGRASQGLPPFGDARDEMTISEYEEHLKEQAEIRKAQAAVSAQAKADVAVADATGAATTPAAKP